MYILNLAEDGRVLSVTYSKYTLYNGISVPTIPDGDVSEYRYVDGKYIHDPLPNPENAELLPTYKERVAALEEAIIYTGILL